MGIDDLDLHLYRRLRSIVLVTGELVAVLFCVFYYSATAFLSARVGLWRSHSPCGSADPRPAEANCHAAATQFRQATRHFGASSQSNCLQTYRNGQVKKR